MYSGQELLARLSVSAKCIFWVVVSVIGFTATWMLPAVAGGTLIGLVAVALFTAAASVALDMARGGRVVVWGVVLLGGGAAILAMFFFIYWNFTVAVPASGANLLDYRSVTSAPTATTRPSDHAAVPGRLTDLGPAGPDGGAVVATTNLNMRSGPGKEYAPLGTFAYGTFLRVVGKEPSGTWLMVAVPSGQVGWMSIRFLKVVEPLAGVPLVKMPPLP